MRWNIAAGKDVGVIVLKIGLVAGVVKAENWPGAGLDSDLPAINGDYDCQPKLETLKPSKIEGHATHTLKGWQRRGNIIRHRTVNH